MRRPGRSVAILGGGPAGATLSTLLARAGLDVVLFARGRRPPIVVGGSFRFRKYTPRIFTGEDATNRNCLGLIEFPVNQGLARNDPTELRVH